VPDGDIIDRDYSVNTKCASCFKPLDAFDRCVHRQRFLDALEYIKSRGILVTWQDRKWWEWKGADSDFYRSTRRIRVSIGAYRLYGWDAMTSILIHEFGHCDLFNEGIGYGSSWEEKLKIEQAANQRGREIMPPHLVPESYEEHRAFFLKSYSEKGWTEEKCRAAAAQAQW
jgi:hypothetical protein